MNKGLSIWLIFLIVAGMVCDYFILKTRTYSGTNIDFTASAGDIIRVAGANEVDVVASGKGYIRISSGELVIKAEPISGSNFSAEGVLSGGTWDILDGLEVAINISSEVPINVAVDKSVEAYVGTIFITILLICLFFFVGILFTY